MNTKKILVIGDVMLDKYTFVDHERYSPEDAGVPVFDVVREEASLGGAANLVKNLVALGCDVDISSIFNSQIEIMLREYKVGVLKYSSCGEPIIKNRVVNIKTNRQECRLDNKKFFGDEDLAKYVTQVRMAIRKVDSVNDYDALIFSDYNKGIVSREVVEMFTRDFNGPIFVDTKKPEANYWAMPNTTIKINSYENARLCDKGDPWALERLIVTLGGSGCLLNINGTQSIYEPSEQVPDHLADPIGAGDCFLAGFVIRWLDTRDDRLSMQFANKVAAASVKKPGTSTVDIGDISK